MRINSLLTSNSVRKSFELKLAVNLCRLNVNSFFELISFEHLNQIGSVFILSFFCLHSLDLPAPTAPTMDGNTPFYNNPRFTAGNAPFNNCPNGNCQRVEAGSQRSCCPGGVCCPNGRCPQREQAPRQQQQQQQQQPQHPVWNSNNGRWQ